MNGEPDYALGYSPGEHARLDRQARRMHAASTRFFRNAGLAGGARVLDLGSGIGDVSMLAADIVGPAGEVVGIERDADSVARARERAAAGGYTNLRFVHGDIATIAESGPFDAAIGRFVLQFVADPANVVAGVARLVRAGGVIAFQEVAWAPALAANARLPLWSATARLTHDTIAGLGANTNIGLDLHRVFLDAQLGAPALTLELQMAANRAHILWVLDLLSSVRARMPSDSNLTALGDLDTLGDRIADEAATARCAVASVGVVGACVTRA